MARQIHSYGQGRVDVFPFKLKDFEEMVRICLVYRDKSKTVKNYYTWYRNYIMLILGCNTGCRIETLLQLTPKHLSGGCARIKEYKTGKIQRYELSPKLNKALNDFIEYCGTTDREFIFKRDLNSQKPITRQCAYKVIRGLADEVGIKYNVGCHSLRKSYGRFLYDQKHDIHLAQRMLGHSNPMITTHYLCLEDDIVDKAKQESEWGL